MQYGNSVHVYIHSYIFHNMHTVIYAVSLSLTHTHTNKQTYTQHNTPLSLTCPLVNIIPAHSPTHTHAQAHAHPHTHTLYTYKHIILFKYIHTYFKIHTHHKLNIIQHLKSETLYNSLVNRWKTLWIETGGGGGDKCKIWIAGKAGEKREKMNHKEVCIL